MFYYFVRLRQYMLIYTNDNFIDVKLPVRKQLDRGNMVRKIDKCYVCKRGVLRGRLMKCHYCNRFYHLNCLDPPIRDWDHSMRWLCPAHNKFYVRYLCILLNLCCYYQTYFKLFNIFF